MLAKAIRVNNLVVGDQIVTKKTPVGRVLKSYPVKVITPCDNYGKYIHVNRSECWTNAGFVEVAR